jgi:hypothetical protein
VLPLSCEDSPPGGRSPLNAPSALRAAPMSYNSMSMLAPEPASSVTACKLFTPKEM